MRMTLENWEVADCRQRRLLIVEALASLRKEHPQSLKARSKIANQLCGQAKMQEQETNDPDWLAIHDFFALQKRIIDKVYTEKYHQYLDENGLERPKDVVVSLKSAILFGKSKLNS